LLYELVAGSRGRALFGGNGDEGFVPDIRITLGGK
jgi:hypothetical protein